MILVRTVSGRRIDLSRPRAEDFALDDIATGLSNCCRFAGQVREFYSVAQHAYLVSLLVPRRLRKHALHHDDSEAYMGDLSRFLKHHELLAGYRALEGPVQGAIERSLRLRDISAADREAVKIADDVAALYEQIEIRNKQVFGLTTVNELIEDGFVQRSFDTLSETIVRMAMLAEGDIPAWNPREARSWFLNAHEEYSTKKETD